MTITNFFRHRTPEQTSHPDLSRPPSLPFKVQALNGFRIDADTVKSGGFSRVTRAVDIESGQYCALKMTRCDRSEPEIAQLATREAYIYTILSEEPCFIHCLGAYRTQAFSGGRTMDLILLQMPWMACNAMEQVSGGRSEAIWGAPGQPLPSIEIQHIFIQMVNAVRKCHEYGIIHRDVKLENFLVDLEGRVRLCDFGLAESVCPVSVESVLPKKQGGTFWTMSPGRMTGSDEGAAGDWYSLGILLYQLHSGGAWPFKSQWTDEERVNAAEAHGAIQKAVEIGRINWAAGIPQDARQMIEGLLDPDPSTRWSLDHVLMSRFIQDAALSQLGATYPDLHDHMSQLMERRQYLQHEYQALGGHQQQLLSRAGGAGHDFSPSNHQSANWSWNNATSKLLQPISAAVAVAGGAAVAAVAAVAAAAVHEEGPEREGLITSSHQSICGNGDSPEGTTSACAPPGAQRRRTCGEMFGTKACTNVKVAAPAVASESRSSRMWTALMRLSTSLLCCGSSNMGVRYEYENLA